MAITKLDDCNTNEERENRDGILILSDNNDSNDEQ